MASKRDARFRALLWTVAVLVAVFVCLQFIRPELTNPPVTAELQAPPEVKQVLKNSCYNCHSNETQLPWFDKVVPAYWLVTSDVNEARKHLDFSEIGKLPAAQQKAFLFEAVNMIQLGAMPLPAYLRVHPNAAVTPEELAVLRDYLTAPPDQDATKAAEAAKAAAAENAADVEYGKWIHERTAESTRAMDVKPEFNGVAYIPDYKNWKVISSTDRFDNHTMREILGTMLR
jgi:cbb3-type cytochrome oxidase cytochrome c subunit